MNVLAIDPSVTGGHAALVRYDKHAPHMTAYGPRALLLWTGTGTVEELQEAAHSLSRGVYPPDVLVVEVARGAVRGKVDADPILAQNVTAGRLLGALAPFAQHGAHPVASGGQATAWNWRVSLGVRGVSGPKAHDDLTRGIVKARLANAPDVPAGPKGGVIQDYWDAVGLGLATLDRLHALHLAAGGVSVADALSLTSALNTHAKRVRKQASKLTRAACVTRGVRGAA